MEFFRIVNIKTTESDLQKRIGKNSIEQINTEIILLEGNEDEFKAGSIWGEFTFRKDKITGGIRFSLLNCPNALAFTITTGYPPSREQIVIHLTINRQQKSKEFIDEINEFLDRWVEGLLSNY